MAGISKKIYTNKSGKIVVRYVITYRDIYGRQHTKGGYKTKAAAQADVYKYQESNVPDKFMTVEDILNEFIESRIQKKRAANTIRNYKNTKKKLKKYFGIDYKKISSLKWQEILYEIRDEISPYVALDCYRLLNGAFDYCNKYKIIASNPFKIVESIELPEKEHNHFEIKELLKLLKLCKENFPKYYALFFTFVATGMREGEIFGLLKENVDFINNRIKVCTQFTNGEFKEKTKTKKSKRYVYMFPTFSQVLKEHIMNDTMDSKLVFHNSKGNFLNQSNVRNRFWIKLLKLAEYPPNYARLQDLRGSNADTALELGLSITYTRDNLGHTTEETTLKHYAKTNKNMIQEGMEKFENVFNPKKCEQNVSKEKKLYDSKIIQFPKLSQSN